MHAVPLEWPGDMPGDIQLSLATGFLGAIIAHARELVKASTGTA